jgi:uncharacterized protein (DUF1697 family)
MPPRKASPTGPAAPRTAPRAAYVALLRGINVGGKNKLPMADLAAMFTGAGCDRVETYIQSGNVVFEAPQAIAEGAAGLIERAITERFGYRIPLVMRTAGELAAVVRDNPLIERGAAPDVLHVVFLAGAPAASRVAALDPQRSPPDEMIARGREIYLSCPNGMGRTRITNAYLDATLATTSTVRNWRTVQKLAEMATGRAPRA